MEILKDILYLLFTSRGVNYTLKAFFDKPSKYLIIIILFLILITLLGAWPVIGIILLIFGIIWVFILTIQLIRVILEKFSSL